MDGGTCFCSVPTTDILHFGSGSGGAVSLDPASGNHSGGIGSTLVVSVQGEANFHFLAESGFM
jgi:hypothetical protein